MKKYKSVFKEGNVESEVNFSTDDDFHKKMAFIDTKGQAWRLMYEYDKFKNPYLILGSKKIVNEYFDDNTIFINASTMHEYKIDKVDRKKIQLKMIK